MSRIAVGYHTTMGRVSSVCRYSIVVVYFTLVKKQITFNLKRSRVCCTVRCAVQSVWVSEAPYVKVCRYNYRGFLQLLEPSGCSRSTDLELKLHHVQNPLSARVISLERPSLMCYIPLRTHSITRGGIIWGLWTHEATRKLRIMERSVQWSIQRSNGSCFTLT
jgi:hypothetical protein